MTPSSKDRPGGDRPVSRKPDSSKPGSGRSGFGRPNPRNSGFAGRRPDADSPNRERPLRDRPPGERGRPDRARPDRGRSDFQRSDSHRGEQGRSEYLRADEIYYSGKNSCFALIEKRPEDVIRAYISQNRQKEYQPIIDFCKEQKHAFYIVPERDLDRLTDSHHHQGIALLSKERKIFIENHLFRNTDSRRNLILVLDRVENPHNIGAILRTAAHFGVKTIVIHEETLARVSGAIFRTSEGGAEHVDLVKVSDFPKFFLRIQQMGFTCYGLEPSESASSLYETRLNERTVLVMGNEVLGLSQDVKPLMNTSLKIPGTGTLQSLNVSVAAALAMAEFNRQGSERNIRFVKSSK